MAQNSPNTPQHSLEHGPSVVQPAKAERQLAAVEGLGELVESINQITVAESNPSQPADQWSNGKPVTQSSSSGAQQTMSARDMAIANLPPAKEMQKQLEAHIRTEVKHLRTEALRIAKLSKPGAAFQLNMLYARIRKLNGLLGELLEAGFDALKRVFIKVFIDRQTIL